MRIVFAEPAKTPAGCVAVFAIPERSLLGYGAALDKATQGALKRAMATTGYSDLKEFQRVEVVVGPHQKS